MDLRETRKQWQQAALLAQLNHGDRLTVKVEGPGVPMYDPSLGRIVYVPVNWPERSK